MNMATGSVVLQGPPYGRYGYGELLASGGKYSANEVPFNELVGLESKTYLPKLPKYLWGHCAVQIDSYHPRSLSHKKRRFSLAKAGNLFGPLGAVAR